MLFTADMIPELMKRTGWTQIAMAEAVGASEQKMTQWMKGRGTSKMTSRHRNGFIAVCVSNCIDTKVFKNGITVEQLEEAKA